MFVYSESVKARVAVRIERKVMTFAAPFRCLRPLVYVESRVQVPFNNARMILSDEGTKN